MVAMPMIQQDFLVHPRAPFRLDLTVWALRRRAVNQIDRWDGTHYTRVLVIDSIPVKVCVSQRQRDNNPELLVTIVSPVADERLPSRVKERLLCMLGCEIDLAGFYTVAKRDSTLHALAHTFLGMKPPRFPSMFEALLNAFACQQVSLDVGLLLLNRLTATYGMKFTEDQ